MEQANEACYMGIFHPDHGYWRHRKCVIERWVNTLIREPVLTRAVPFRFRGLETIGTVIFLFNIVLYLGIWSMLLTRFYLYPYTFRASFTHPTESLFVPAVAVSFGTILINIVEYGFGKTGLWLNHAVLVLFWFDAALAVFLSVLIYMILYALKDHIFTCTDTTPDGRPKPSQSHA